MKKNNVLALLCVSIFLLQGCAGFKKASHADAKNQNALENPMIQVNQPSSTQQLTSLQKCLNDATTLVKLGSKYQKNYNDLHVLINDAKFYASLSNETSDNVKATIAPLFEYQINDKCNDISQLLIDAFKQKIKQTSMLNGNS
ncbi:hypothetical protein AB7Z36_12285 [Providencia rettgeri]